MRVPGLTRNILFYSYLYFFADVFVRNRFLFVLESVHQKI
jgi:hypothetical protein